MVKKDVILSAWTLKKKKKSNTENTISYKTTGTSSHTCISGFLPLCYQQGLKLPGVGGGTLRKFEFRPAKCWSRGHPCPNTQYFQDSKLRSHLEIPLVFFKHVGEFVPCKAFCRPPIPLITLKCEFIFLWAPDFCSPPQDSQLLGPQKLISSPVMTC